MRKRRNATIVTALAAALSVPALLGAHPAQADEPADLRVNQELLQRRLDQLAQARIPGNPYGVGTPAGPVNVQMTGGSFASLVSDPGHRYLDPGRRRDPDEQSLLDCRRQPEPEPAKHQRRHHGTVEQCSASWPSTGKRRVYRPRAQRQHPEHAADAIEAERRDAHSDGLGRSAKLS